MYMNHHPANVLCLSMGLTSVLVQHMEPTSNNGLDDFEIANLL